MNFYYFSLCHVCKKASPDLKKCSKCKVVHYCSREHQKQDWSSHKELCIVIAKVNKLVRKPPCSSPSDFFHFKSAQALLWQFAVERQLTSAENDMWKFPKVCAVCYTSEVSIVCSVCLSVAYCSEAHRTADGENHDLQCQKLKQVLEIHQELFESDPGNLLDFDFPHEVKALPESLEEVLKIINFKKNFGDLGNPAVCAMLGDVFSEAVNVVYALEKSKFIKKRRAKKTKLTIHLATSELVDSAEWIVLCEFLSHWILNLKVIKIFIVSPQIENDQMSFIHNCSDCEKKKLVGLVVGLNGHYSNHVELIPKPDVVVALGVNWSFLAGDLDVSDDVKALIHHSGVPAILTGHSLARLERGLEAFPTSAYKFYVEPQVNAYASLRPERGSDENYGLVCYRNKHIAIITGDK